MLKWRREKFFFFTFFIVSLLFQALGKTGKVTKVYTDGDLRVQQLDDGFSWTLNPKCVKLERSPAMTAIATERSNSMMDLSHQRSDHVMTPLSDLSGTSAVDKLVREAALGRLDYVKQYLDAHPDQGIISYFVSSFSFILIKLHIFL